MLSVAGLVDLALGWGLERFGNFLSIRIKLNNICCLLADTPADTPVPFSARA